MLLSQLAGVVGVEGLRDPVSLSQPAGWPPALVEIAPATASQAVEVVRAAEQAGMALIPCGGGTMLHTGYPPSADRRHLMLSARRMDRILDYQPDDMTVTCEPGVTLATLQRTLAERRQRLALDVPLPRRATLGGITSANASGFDRPAYGAPRDLLIGLRAVIAGGAEVKGGGKVVKNVAGYDVCKLFAGSWGTLGFITELTFKVTARPEKERMVAWPAPDLATAARAGLALHHARLAGISFLVTNELYGSAPGAPHLAVGLQGMARRVDWQVMEYARLAREAGLTDAPEEITPEQTDDWRDRLARIDPQIAVAARIACLPTEVTGLLSRLSASPDLLVTAHCASGIVTLAATAPATLNPGRLQALMPPAANLTWVRIDPDVPGSADVARWGGERGDFLLHRGLKQSIDPTATFSPGRFLGRL